MFESLLKRLLRRKVERKVENAMETAIDNAFKPNTTTATTPAAQPAAQPAGPAPASADDGFFARNAAALTAPAEDDWDTDYNNDINYFRPIIQANFPDYTLEENVPFAQLVSGVKYNYPPYTFVMRKNGQIALVISLQSKYSYKKGLHTMCEWKAQLKHINFFIEYPDRADYVVNRIRENLAF